MRSRAGSAIVSGLNRNRFRSTIKVRPPAQPPAVAPAKIASLGVLTCHFNPCGYKLPIENFHRFADGVKRSGTPLYTIELVFGDQEPQTNPDVLIRGDADDHRLWQKERLLNILIEQVGSRHDALAWIDADILFVRPDWPTAAMRCLETHAVAQLFDHSYQAAPNGHLVLGKPSTGSLYATRREDCVKFDLSHPGFAWVGRSDWMMKHGLLDTSVSGSGDLQMISGFVGRDLPINDRLAGTGWLHSVETWARTVHPDIRESLGFIEGAIVHLFHGFKRNRKYVDRWQWLVSNRYDPATDIETCPRTGLIRWTDHARRHKPQMIASVSEYFTTRREDG